MTDNRYRAAILRKLIIGQDVPTLADAPEPWAGIWAAVSACPDIPARRSQAFDAALADLDPSTAEDIRAAVHAADPAAPLPEQPRKIGEIYVPELPEAARILVDQGLGVCPWLDCYIDYASKVSPMTPPDFHESAALWLASVAIARRLVLKMPFGDIYPNLFILWLAETTLFHKTTALNLARAISREVFPHLLAYQDTTPEAFLSDMAGQQPANFGGMTEAEQQDWKRERNFSAQRGWVIDEMSGLMSGAGKDYNAGLLETLLRFYDCDPHYTRSTRAQGRVVVTNSYLALLGASTPAAMAFHLTSERLWGLGWWPRFALLTPPEERPDWKDAIAAVQPSMITSDLARLYKRLPVADYPEHPKPIDVILGKDVYQAWQDYNRAMSFDLLTPDLDMHLWGTYGRMPSHMIKIAMILAAFDWPEGGTCKIELRHLARAFSIAEKWRASAHRAKNLSGASNFEQMKKRILRQVSKHPEGATLRDIYMGLRDKTPGEIELSLSDMVLAGILEELEPEPGKRGRPAKRFRIEAD